MNYEEFANFLDSREKEERLSYLFREESERRRLEIERLINENEELKDRNLVLTQTIEQQSNGKKISEAISCNFNTRIIEALINTKKLSPTLSLQIIKEFYSERIIVLDDAMSSAEEIDNNFQKNTQLLDLLYRLATKYWDYRMGLSKDIGFNSDEYSKESDTTMRDSRLRFYRIKSFEGRKLVMEDHLKPSYSERVHFCWDELTKKVIIGHCGPHLPI